MYPVELSTGFAHNARRKTNHDFESINYTHEEGIDRPESANWTWPQQTPQMAELSGRAGRLLSPVDCPGAAGWGFEGAHVHLGYPVTIAIDDTWVPLDIRCRIRGHRIVVSRVDTWRAGSQMKIAACLADEPRTEIDVAAGVCGRWSPIGGANAAAVPAAVNIATTDIHSRARIV
jgi:hypothetical protein